VLTALILSGLVSCSQVDLYSLASRKRDGPPIPRETTSTVLFVSNSAFAVGPVVSLPNGHNGESLGAYLIDGQTGALTAAPGTPYVDNILPGSGPIVLAIEPQTKLVYMGLQKSEGSTVLVGFTIDPVNAALASAGGTIGVLGAGFPGGLAVANKPGPILFTTGTTQSTGEMMVVAYPISSAGSLGNPVLTPVPGSIFGEALVFDKAKRFLFVVDLDSILTGFSVDSAGALTPNGTVIVGGLGIGSKPVVDPTGRYLLGTTSVASSSAIQVYQIDQTTGTLTPVAGSPFLTGNTGDVAIAFDPQGQFLFTADSNSNAVSVLRFDSTTGVLTPVPGSPFSAGAGTKPSALAVEPDGQYLYVAEAQANGVARFRIDRTSGSITLVDSVVTGRSPFGIVIGKIEK